MIEKKNYLGFRVLENTENNNGMKLNCKNLTLYISIVVAIYQTSKPILIQYTSSDNDRVAISLFSG